ncbi:tabserin-like [Anoplolepis gracilipes]|uniref:tabserin-like n=1 Tax=Anoplolepis gracilipes TaxID=354296 RepID=UPI003B9ED3A7
MFVELEAIINGISAAPGEFPWQVSLNYKGKHICGGSIIAQTKILTAGHCVDFIESVNNLRIVSGTIDATKGQVHAVQSIRIHPYYDGLQRSTWMNDVAVITVS